MINPPKTRSEAIRVRYGEWAGNPRGYPYSQGHCAWEVADPAGWRYHQCTRPLGHGPSHLYCSQHAKRFTE